MYEQNLHLQAVSLHWKLIPPLSSADPPNSKQVLSIMSRMQPTQTRDKQQVPLWFSSSISHKTETPSFIHKSPRLAPKIPCSWAGFPRQKTDYEALGYPCTRSAPFTCMTRKSAWCSNFIQPDSPLNALHDTHPCSGINRVTAFLPSVKNRPAHRLPTALPSPISPEPRTPPGVFST